MGGNLKDSKKVRAAKVGKGARWGPGCNNPSGPGGVFFPPVVSPAEVAAAMGAPFDVWAWGFEGGDQCLLWA